LSQGSSTSDSQPGTTNRYQLFTLSSGLSNEPVPSLNE
jgi:hypothetical protein